ncbi:response regulator [Sphingomonas sp. RB3P16]|uniref:response regulator transcription factor n=1 Tax=Parasphingomonas frigoris TaxID=3096163 RepID=UPI002FC7204C
MTENAVEPHAGVVAIVDDDEAIRMAIGRLIRTIGYHSRTFPSAEGLLLEIENFLPTCIITDIQMPQMNGLDLVKELVKRGVKVPVMVMTAYPSLANRELALLAGASEYLTKPLDIGRLEAWLSKVDSRHRPL